MPTLDDLLALPAGRELDAAVAEAMGKRVERHERGQPYTVTVKQEMGTSWTQRYSIPHYSTDIAAAFPLLAEMLEQTEAPIELWFLAGVGLNIHMEGDLLALVPTVADAPLAICRARLAWKVGGEA